ncbi:hypothetical protein B7494_g6744 [Chlorociboria aeruginascens]|nr:hypothetical protein B7494_g6744 [Chlorociboria aeruginascens]
MVRTTLLIAALASASTAFAQTACSASSQCPESSPCCSQYGQCGVGAYCLGGCDPIASFSLDSCVPEPVCQSKTYNLNSMDGITSKTDYLGDSTTTDWVMDGQAVPFDNNILLTMAAESSGTVLASSTYMWYGNVKTKFKTSRGQGVITAFILLSDVKDEIDYEFVGVDLGTAQTNYYFQGITDYDNSGNITLSDTFDNFHEYEIDWTPDQITWLVDGQVGRTKKRSDTWNATSNQWDFPQTPARVQLSIWPGGLASNAPGTIAWAGGEISWTSPDIQANGYYYATFESVTISCFNATSAPGTNTGTSYTYNNIAATNNTVVDGDKPTVLKSLLGTGTDMNAGESSASASASGSTATSTAQTVPGLSNTGPSNDNHSGDDSSSSAPSSSATSSSSGSSSSGSTSGTDGTFSQGDGSSGSSSSSSTKSAAEKLGASNERPSTLVLRSLDFALGFGSCTIETAFSGLALGLHDYFYNI